MGRGILRSGLVATVGVTLFGLSAGQAAAALNLPAFGRVGQDAQGAQLSDGSGGAGSAQSTTPSQTAPPATTPTGPTTPAGPPTEITTPDPPAADDEETGDGKDTSDGQGKDTDSGSGQPGDQSDGGGEENGTDPTDPTADPNQTDPTGLTSDPPGAPAPVLIPDAVLSEFDIPPYALRIYMAAGSMCDVPWEVLASIHYHETRFSTNLSVSSAGAVGHMQFMPATWSGGYAVDADGDGVKDPFSLYDSVFAAACYLRAAGAPGDLQKAVFAYNHSDSYVNSVLTLAKRYHELPPDFINALVQLSSGIFPVRAEARFQDSGSVKGKRSTAKIFSESRAPVVAATSGRVARVGSDSVTVEDPYGNRYVYRNLGSVAKWYPVPKQDQRDLDELRQDTDKAAKEMDRLRNLPEPDQPATSDDATGDRADGSSSNGNRKTADAAASLPDAPKPARKLTAEERKQRDEWERIYRAKGKEIRDYQIARRDGEPLDAAAAPAGKYEGDDLVVVPGNSAEERARVYAHPARPNNEGKQPDIEEVERQEGDEAAGSPTAGEDPWRPVGEVEGSGEWQVFTNRHKGLIDPDPDRYVLKQLKVGSEVAAGTLLGRMSRDDSESHLSFRLKPAGKGTPWVDPRSMLKTWKINEETGIHNFLGKTALTGSVTPGQALLLPEEILAQRVLNDRRIDVYPCGRRDIAAGRISPLVLGTLEYLAESGYRLGISSLMCGHSILTTSGTRSHHADGNAVDISVVNGKQIFGNQGPGGITEQVVDRLRGLQGKWRPAQIISLLNKGGNTFAMSNHDDHIHVGWSVGRRQARVGQAFRSIMKPAQWERLMERLTKVDDPIVPRNASRFAIGKRHKLR